MQQSDRRCVLVAVRLTRSEHTRWLRIAAREDLRLVELIRESVRAHCRDLERLRLVGSEQERGPRTAVSSA
jgi:hypothetical protein